MHLNLFVVSNRLSVSDFKPVPGSSTEMSAVVNPNKDEDCFNVIEYNITLPEAANSRVVQDSATVGKDVIFAGLKPYDELYTVTVHQFIMTDQWSAVSEARKWSNMTNEDGKFSFPKHCLVAADLNKLYSAKCP